MRCTPDVRLMYVMYDHVTYSIMVVTIDIGLVFCSLPRLSSTVVSGPLTEDAQTDRRRTITLPEGWP